jgi:hypothetical protein
VSELKRRTRIVRLKMTTCAFCSTCVGTFNIVQFVGFCILGILRVRADSHVSVYTIKHYHHELIKNEQYLTSIVCYGIRPHKNGLE